MVSRHLVGIDVEHYSRRRALVLVNSSVPAHVLYVDLAEELARRLTEHNRRTADPALRLRLRMAVHSGEIASDDHGVSGAALNLASRLLEAPVLRAALARAAGDLVVLVSDAVHESVEAPDRFRPVQVANKETSTNAWLWVDGGEPGALVSLAGGPYKGLAPFEIRDAPLFFGRDQIVDELLTRLGEPVEGGHAYWCWSARRARASRRCCVRVCSRRWSRVVPDSPAPGDHYY